jgi:hypothetical protein
LRVPIVHWLCHGLLCWRNLLKNSRALNCQRVSTVCRKCFRKLSSISWIGKPTCREARASPHIDAKIPQETKTVYKKRRGFGLLMDSFFRSLARSGRCLFRRFCRPGLCRHWGSISDRSELFRKLMMPKLCLCRRFCRRRSRRHKVLL